ncbi:hypothetical protein EJ05DRAFT_541728 [Pseudovirgaria hyperparasitica]|uniref:Sulfhydryl oxidase n=1 Tax=Pseudovirgaria hyperparasitica TaxID=470096 RepID=A0A6A6VV27_9PEZI|nr:uncharacterized protein EJ05DRAFT_541728 [Pseudovirgaria hyperparasitica]KAF2753729.1 hypothetical protein EJ05DRAFT_541728 [Pseudovirgaria hyperparasitica]
MPVTSLDLPILARFLCAVESTTGMPPQPLDATPEQREAAAQAASTAKELPKGVVLGPDGKPCRTCTSAASWKALTQRAKHSTNTTTSATASTTTNPTTAAAVASSSSSAHPTTSQTTPSSLSTCPPDVDQLGRSTWTLLHSITGAYPASPSPTLQSETSTFIRTFAKLYPCWVCADDFQAWMRRPGNAPRVSSRDEFGRWMCDAHNAVNEKLGKERFDCARWEERWRTGWRDGSCD